MLPVNRLRELPPTSAEMPAGTVAPGGSPWEAQSPIPVPLVEEGLWGALPSPASVGAERRPGRVNSVPHQAAQPSLPEPRTVCGTCQPKEAPMSCNSTSAPPLPACGCLSWSTAVNQHASRDSDRRQAYRWIRGLEAGGWGWGPGLGSLSLRAASPLIPGEPLGVTTTDCGPDSQALGTRQ